MTTSASQITGDGAPTTDASRDPSTDGIAGVVVAFRPVPTQIKRLISALSQECNIVLIMDNGGAREAIGDACTMASNVRIVDMGGNQGIGEALNCGFRRAKASGIRYVAMFDQDSEPPPGLIGDLVEATTQLLDNGINVAAVGPATIDIRGSKPLAHPFMRTRMGWPTLVESPSDSQYAETDFLITSGCLISLATYEIVGPFDEGMFVDCTDIEWCLRAKAAGFRHFGIFSLTMKHELGSGTNTKVMGLTFLGHGPMRRYYYARNTVRLLKLSYTPLGWKARLAFGLTARVLLLPLAAKFKPGWTKEWLMMRRGILDGFAGVGGLCPDQA